MKAPPGLPPGAAGSRACEQHRRNECTSIRSYGRGPCHGIAIRGTSKCRVHSGVSLKQAKAQGEARITAWHAFGAPATIDYRMAVLGVLQMTCLRLATYGELLRRQVAAEGEDTEPLTDQNADGELADAGGLIGHRYGMGGKDGILYRQTEEVRALVSLEAAERDRVVKFAKTAHDMGISDRLTNLAERWGDIVASRMAAMLGDLNLSPEQALLVPELISKHLGSVDLEAIGGSVKENAA
jgi:hypothetical protein